jgi:hypothetical protein
VPELEEYRKRVMFKFTLMVGDNIYGSERPQDFVEEVRSAYKPLLDAGVTFYAALGNHDDPNQRFYKPFNMDGERFYSSPKATSSSSCSTRTTWTASSSTGSNGS